MLSSALAPGEYPVASGCIASIVTYLRRDHGPLEHTPSFGETFRLEWTRAMLPRDYRSLFVEIGGKWLWFSRLEMDDAALLQILAKPQTHVGVLYDGAKAIGLVEMDAARGCALELSFLGLADGYEGRGLGQALLEQGIAKAWHSKVQYVETHTCTLDHPAALDFYLSCGFAAVRRSVEVAPDPRLSGLLASQLRSNYPVV